jgi:hypothetical protein
MLSFGVGGAISAMKNTLKNNKRERKSAFDKLKQHPGEHPEGELHFENTATQAQLQKIREKVQRENRMVMIRNVSIIVVIMLVLIYLVGFA